MSTAADIMQRDVVTIGPEAGVVAAADLMAARGISGLPVVGPDGRLAGILTEGDLLRRVELGTDRRVNVWSRLFTPDAQLAQRFAKAHGLKVREVMSRNVATITPDTPLSRIARLLDELNVKRLPVVDGAGRLVGIVARRDVLRALAAVLREPTAAPASTDDGAIAAEFRRQLRAQPWISASLIAFTVRDGVVTLTGAVSAEGQRQALSALAEGIPGVRDVNVQGVIVSAGPI